MDPRVRRFILTAIPLLLAFLVSYPSLLSGYSPLILRTSGMLLELSDPPIELDAQSDGAWYVSTSMFRGRLDIRTRTVFLGLAVIPALVLATPVGMAARVRLLLMALACLFVVHVVSLTVVISVLAKYCQEPGSRTCEITTVVLIPWSHVTSFGLWGLVTWRYWFGGSNEPAGRAPGSTPGARVSRPESAPRVRP